MRRSPKLAISLIICMVMLVFAALPASAAFVTRTNIRQSTGFATTAGSNATQGAAVSQTVVNEDDEGGTNGEVLPPLADTEELEKTDFNGQILDSESGAEQPQPEDISTEVNKSEQPPESASSEALQEPANGTDAETDEDAKEQEAGSVSVEAQPPPTDEIYAGIENNLQDANEDATYQSIKDAQEEAFEKSTAADQTNAAVQNTKEDALLLQRQLDEQEMQTSVVPMAGGLLALNAVPSFTFSNNNTISHKASTYTATGVSNKIVVADNRLLSSGWRLTAQMGSFTNGSNSNVLAGARLTLPLPVVTFSGVVIQAPVSYITQMTAGETSEHTVMSASIGVSLGTWTGTYTAGNIFLNVAPGTAYAGTSTSTIVWTLYDSP